MYRQINAMTTATLNAGGFDYINDKVPPTDIDPLYAQVLSKLIELNLTDTNHDAFRNFYDLNYNSDHPTDEEIAKYDANKNACAELVQNINANLSLISTGADGRIIIVNPVTIIYDSSMPSENNTLINAKANTINTFPIQYTSSYMTSNRSQTKIGFEIYHPPISHIKTVYLAYTLGPFGYNDMTVIYCVSWNPPNIPIFLS